MADTVLAGASTAPPDAAAAPAPPPPAPAPAAPRKVKPAFQRPMYRDMGVGFLLLALVVLGFAGYLYGLSGVQEARSQKILYTQLLGQLAQINGEVAPLGPTAPGNPIAVMNIPDIGIHDMVVVEGTSPENLTVGPGHLRDTPYPGQAGTSEIFGRRATFGGPFAHLDDLRPGAFIQTTTGEGQATYTVVAVGDSTHRIVDPDPNKMLLFTASSPVIPSYYVEVDAHLSTPAKGSPGVTRQIDSTELPLAGDSGALVMAWTWALALAIVSALGTLAASRWSPWPAYIAAVPLALAVLWNLYESLAALLPNLY
jgi:LPXTG-site transpeptidase (sortase) family protein